MREHVRRRVEAGDALRARRANRLCRAAGPAADVEHITAVRQLRGECYERQVPGAKLALVNGTGGALSSTGTLVLGVD